MNQYQNRLTVPGNSQLLMFLGILIVVDIPNDLVTEAYAGGSLYQVFLGPECLLLTVESLDLLFVGSKTKIYHLLWISI